MFSLMLNIMITGGTGFGSKIEILASNYNYVSLMVFRVIYKGIDGPRVVLPLENGENIAN
jgi:hypothetical protein